MRNHQAATSAQTEVGPGCPGCPPSPQLDAPQRTQASPSCSSVRSRWAQWVTDQEACATVHGASSIPRGQALPPPALNSHEASHPRPPARGFTRAGPPPLHTIVQLGGWPQGAGPEVGRLARGRNRGFWDVLGCSVPSPPREFVPTVSAPLGRDWASWGASVDHPQAQLTTCHSLTPGFLPRTLMQLLCWGLGLRAGPAGVPGVARRGAPS